jgi:tRNA U34 5-methylaminomethyl-2-thiouridine-forming methyltransferase MnmC
MYIWASNPVKMPEIIRTEDGSDTLYVRELNEHYHSVHGAIRESDHIFIRHGFDFFRGENVRIFEAGFGTGLNAILTLAANREIRKIQYTAIERFPLPLEIISKLNYASLIPEEYKAIFTEIHTCAWNTVIKITDSFSLFKINDDLASCRLTGESDLIYFDAFGPDKQPEMWTDDIFHKISKVTALGGILVTYSAKGEVRRKLTRNGFKVELLPGPPGKRQMIRAVKI